MYSILYLLRVDVRDCGVVVFGGWYCIGIVHCYGSTRVRQEKKEEEEIKDGGVIDILVYYYIMKYVRLITRWFPAPSSLRY